jgi:anaerobic magnesium-protoporphyrin IX monomethyl ester cyclase
MKILLLFPKWTGNYGIIGYFAKRASTWPPLNLAYLAGIAEKQGHKVKIIDGEAENISISEMVEQAALFKPDIIGLTATTPFFHVTAKLAEELKHHFNRTPIILGGSHITILKEKVFNPSFDYAFIGESDHSWPLFLNQYENGKDISKVKGILYRKNGSIRFSGEAEPIIDIDSIPLPARHLLMLDKYKIGTLQGKKTFTTVMTMRGCPFKCIFCSTKVFGNRVRKRSPRLVVDEMISVISKFNIKHFILLDDTLSLDREHILELCNIIIDEKLGITLDGSTRANLVDEELVSKMAEAGFIRISFGLESVDPNIRTIMKKNVPLESYREANKLTSKYNIETLNSCMIGLPGETVATVRKTLRFLRNSREIKQANISIATPYPGTELYEMAKKGEHGMRLLTDNFAEFRRYGSAVMSVGDLSPADLIKLQNDAFVSIYLAPWRLIPMLKKSGIIGCILTFMRLLKSLKRVILNTDGLFRFGKDK